MNKQTVTKFVLAVALLASSAPAFAGKDCDSKACDSKACTKTKAGKAVESSLPKISRADLQAKLDKVTIVNALDAKMFERSRIKGSVSVPYETVEVVAAQVLPDKNAELVVYCMNTKCHASDKVADSLSKIGYKNVSIYREGLQDWISASLPLEGSNPTEPVAKKTANK